MNPREVVDFVMQLQDEVSNGGFHQFFNNSSGNNTVDTIQALEAIGATVVAAILRRAASKFPNNTPPRDRRQRLDVLWANFPRTDEFRDLDTEFFAYPEDLSGLIAAYKHRFPD